MIRQRVMPIFSGDGEAVLLRLATRPSNDALYPSVCYYLRVIKHQSRGMTVGGTLLAVAVLAALAAALASLCVTHIRTSNRAESALHASNLARSAIAQAIAEVLNNQEYGVGQLPEETVAVETEHGTAYLSFNPDLAEQQGVMNSTNNAAGTTTAEGGDGRVVPANSVHLVARGHSGGVVRQVETILSVPSFPWALAANGEVVIRDGAIVGSLPEGVWPPNPGDLEPADIVSNSTSDTAILLGSGSRVLGNVETPGQVVLADSTVQVDGQIREAAEPNTLPQMKAEEFDPEVLGIAFDDVTGVSAAAVTSATTSGGGTGAAASGFSLAGAARHDGDMTISDNVTLEGGALFVDGNLTVNGNIQGTGILVVDGDITVTSGVTLDGATKVAIVSSGKVTLRGVGPTSSSIRGLFYAEDGLLAEEITVVGALIAAGPDAGVELVNSRALSQSVQSSTTASTGTSGGSSSGGGSSGVSSGSTVMTTMFKDFLDGDGGGGGGGLPDSSTTTTTPDTQGTGRSEASNFIPLKERIRVISWFES